MSSPFFRVPKLMKCVEFRAQGLKALQNNNNNNSIVSCACVDCWCKGGDPMRACLVPFLAGVLVAVAANASTLQPLRQTPRPSWPQRIQSLGFACLARNLWLLGKHGQCLSRRDSCLGDAGRPSPPLAPAVPPCRASSARRLQTKLRAAPDPTTPVIRAPTATQGNTRATKRASVPSHRCGRRHRHRLTVAPHGPGKIDVWFVVCKLKSAARGWRGC